MEEDLKLEPHEKKRVREIQSVNARVIYDAIKRDGESELERPSVDLAFSGLAAGISLGFSFAVEAFLRRHLPDTEWRFLLVKLGYPIGFLMVIMGRQQLFTENTLTPMIPLLDKSSDVTFAGVLRLWVTVFFANVAGAAAFALAAATTVAFDPEVRLAMHAISIEGFHGGQFGVVLIKAIFAGWLIAMVAWLMPAAETSKIWVIIILTYVIGIGGFPHVVAGSTSILYSVFDGSLSAASAITHFMLPALIGNMIGGTLLVAALNYAQVAASDEAK